MSFSYLCFHLVHSIPKVNENLEMIKGKLFDTEESVL